MAMKAGLKITNGGLALVPGAQVVEAAGGDSAKSKAVQFFEDIDWHALAGKRVTAVRRDLMHPGTHLPVLMEALIVRAKESVTVWYSKNSSEHREVDEPPMLHDMLWPERSPVNAILQFFSSMLAGEHKCVLLLSRSRGRATMQGFWRTHPEEVAFIRIALVNASTWSFIRGVARFKRYPWIIAVITDMRRPWDDRLDVALSFMSKKLCCLDKGFCRRLRRRLGNDARIQVMMNDGILSKFCLDMVWVWVQQISGTTQDLELRHGRYRRFTCPQSKVGFFLANAVNMETMWNQRTCDALTDAPVQGSDQPAHELLISQHDSLHSSLSAIQAFHRECCSRDRTMGLRFNPCSKEYWQKVKEEFEDLDEQEKERRSELAAKSREASWSDKRRAALEVAQRALPLADRQAPQNSLVARGECECCKPEQLPRLAGLPIDADEMKQFEDDMEENKKVGDLWNNSVEGLAKDEGDIPACLRAPRMCSGLCRKTAGANQWSLFCQLQDSMSRIVRRPLMSVDQLNVVFCFRVTVGQARKYYLAMPTLVYARGLANTVDSDHCYLLLRHVSDWEVPDEPLDFPRGKLMEFSRCEFHKPAEPELSMFTEGVSKGALEHMLSDAYFASCIPFDASSVSVYCVPFSWRGLDTLVTTDVEGGDHLLVTLQPQERHHARQNADSDSDVELVGDEEVPEEEAVPELQQLLEVAGVADEVEPPDVNLDVDEAPEDDEDRSGSEDVGDAFPDVDVDNGDDDVVLSAPALSRRLPDLHVDIRSRHIEWDDRTGRVFELVAGGERGRLLGTAKWLGIGGLKCVCALHPKRVSVQGEAKECGFIVPMGPEKIADGFAACSWFFKLGAAYHEGACMSAAKAHHRELISSIKDIVLCCFPNPLSCTPTTPCARIYHAADG